MSKHGEEYFAWVSTVSNSTVTFLFPGTKRKETYDAENANIYKPIDMLTLGSYIYILRHNQIVFFEVD